MTEQPRQASPSDEELVPVDDAVIGRAFRWSLLAIVLIALIVIVVVMLLRWEPTQEVVVIEKDPGDIPDLVTPVETAPAVTFVDIASGAGVNHVHFSGATGEKLLPETMGGGTAFLDYNNDGRQDLLFVNGASWPHDPSRDDAPSSIQLYRNEGSGTFNEVTSEVGLESSFYGMGIAVGDTDNDGDVDLFFTAVGPNHFYRNDGETFTSAADDAGLRGNDEEWSASAGFFDMNHNGWIDLFVCNYVRWSRAIDIELNFTLNGRDRAYGPPTNYRGVYSYLYRNNADGTFDEISDEAGIRVDNPATGLPAGKALAVVFTDVDRDGLLDIVVANDTTQNFLFRNRGDETFEEVGARAGVAFSSEGQATGAMGIDAAHYRNDEHLGIGIGNFANEMTSLYVSQRDAMQFSDEAIGEGVGSPTRLRLTFGLFFFDADLDGRMDLFQTNGHLEDEINQIQSSQHYRQPAQLFWNCGPEQRSCFIEMPTESLGDLVRPIVGRGAAFADIDDDGDLDLVLTQVDGPSMLLRNDQQLDHHWLRLRLIGNGIDTNRDAIGAVIELTAGSVRQRKIVMPTRSYLSQVELPVTFGLGTNESIESLRITWPGGETREIDVADLELDRTHVIQQAAPAATG